MAIANYAKTCVRNVAGCISVFFSEVGNIGTVTITAGEITAVTMDTTGNTFHEFDADVDSISYSQEGSGGKSYFANRALKIGLSKLTKEVLTAKSSLVDAVACGVVAIFVDGNSQAFMTWNDTEKERRPLNVIEDNFNTGEKPSDEDASLFLITLSGETGYDATPFDSTLTTSIVDETTAASAFITFN